MKKTEYQRVWLQSNQPIVIEPVLGRISELYELSTITYFEKNTDPVVLQRIEQIIQTAIHSFHRLSLSKEKKIALFYEIRNDILGTYGLNAQYEFKIGSHDFAIFLKRMEELFDKKQCSNGQNVCIEAYVKMIVSLNELMIPEKQYVKK